MPASSSKPLEPEPLDLEHLGLFEAIRRALVVTAGPAAVDGIGCLLLDEAGALRFAAASDTTAQALEVAEELCVEGPCHEAFAHGEVMIADVQLEARWERLGTLLAASPVRTVIGVPVTHRGTPIGAVDAFSALPRIWEDQHFEDLRRTADVVGTLVERALELGLDAKGDALAARVREGLDNQRLLGRASQIIAEVSGVSVPRASLQLRQMAAATGVAAISIADQTIEHGALPAPVELASQTEALRRAREQLATLALSDPLTGLANRVLLLEHLDGAIERSKRSTGVPAIVFCDLDRFKTVNDSLGHEVGDEVLRMVAGRLVAAARAYDTVARLGGDEFAVLLEDVGSDREASRLAIRLREALDEPMTVTAPSGDGRSRTRHTLRVGASMGVATAVLGSATSAAALLRDADLAMYESKRRDLGQLTSFTSELRAAEHRRTSIELSLRSLLEGRRPGDPLTDGLRLAYQPIVTLGDGRLDSVEALVRWNHPELGEVTAPEIIGVAEAAGLMRPLGAALLSAACATAASWRRDHGADELVVAVNVSALQLDDPGFVAIVIEALETTGFPADRLCLELTESHLFTAAGDAIDALTHLSDRGVGITLDDFGTGYSSLSHLARLPVDKVKIDREFIALLGDDGHATAVAQTVVALARSLDLGTVAEGIETPAQAELAIELEFDLGQGYLYQRPVTPERIIDLLGSDGRIGPGTT
jgi:diguanylate cyclase (GGDEF)-like protein